MVENAIRKIKNKVHGRNTNKAQGKAKYFIGIKAVHRVLYFTYSKS